MPRKISAKVRPSPPRRGSKRAKQAFHVETFSPQTELGKRLYALRSRIVASGQPLLNWDEIEQEVQSRRNGSFEDV